MKLRTTAAQYLERRRVSGFGDSGERGRVQGLGFGVWGLGFGVLGVGFRA